MSKTERLVTEYTADTRGFDRGVAHYDRTLARQERFANDRLTRMEQRWERSSRDMLRSRTALVGALAAVTGGAAVAQLRTFAEAWRSVERSLSSIGEAGAEAQKGIATLAIRTRSDIGGTAAAVQRMAKSTGADLDTTSRRVETLQKLLAYGGATGGERASVSLQLGQALKAGVLSGDEYKSLSENAPVEFLDALAKAAGITRAELKGFAADQQLTTRIVLQALDSLADTADKAFAGLAVSGEEAFDVLQTGLTVYVGNVDQALGATASINGAMVWLGEYLTDTGDAAETMADAIRIVGVMALATAGSRGVGALSAALQRSAVTARVMQAEAAKDVAASTAKVAAIKSEIAASAALVAQRRAEVVATVRAGGSIKASLNATGKALDQLEKAKKRNATASAALAGAEARALVATDRLAAATRNMSFAVRASTAALSAARGVLAFFGGPVGLAVTALSALPLLLTESGDRTDDLRAAAGKAEDALSRYAAASRKLGEEQAKMGGKITAATQAMVTQERVDLQNSLSALREESRALRSDIESSLSPSWASFQDSPIDILNRSQNAMMAGGVARNPYLDEAITALRELEAGQGDMQQIIAALTQVRGVGSEARDVMRDYKIATEDSAVSMDAARTRMIQYAEAAGHFSAQLAAIEAAPDPASKQTAYDALAQALQHAVDASATMGGAGVDAIADMARALFEAETKTALFEAGLRGDTEEVARLREMLDASQASAADLAATPTPDYSGSANSAASLASELERAVKAAIALRSQSVTGLQRAQIDNRFRKDPIGRARALAEAQFDADTATAGPLPDAAAADLARRRAEYVAREVEAETLRQATIKANQADAKAARGGGGSKKKGGGGSGKDAAAQAERDLAEARGLLLENGQKALYIEQELNAERARLAELKPQLIQLGLSEADAQGVLNSELERTRDRLSEVQTESEKAAAAFARGVLDDIRHAENLGDAVSRVGDRLLDLALDPVFDMLANNFAKMVTGGGKAGGGVGGFFGKVFGGLFSANGNAFTRVGVQPFANGGIVDRATPFRFGGNRLGVMGEAGPEAIMPLTRGSDGKLGVIAQIPTPTVPAAPGALSVAAPFNWSGDMVINSASDDPQAVGAEVTAQMRAMFAQMFGKSLQDAMRAGGLLETRFQRKGGL